MRALQKKKKKFYSKWENSELYIFDYSITGKIKSDTPNLLRIEKDTGGHINIYKLLFRSAFGPLLSVCTHLSCSFLAPGVFRPYIPLHFIGKYHISYFLAYQMEKNSLPDFSRSFNGN